jgi:hypothetical protein
MATAETKLGKPEFVNEAFVDFSDGAATRFAIFCLARCSRSRGTR